ncbi:MAG: hypothetical protein GHCLOJNM_02044 [bacterium]|nr:hypothetical protein [bacterium]
MPPHENALHLHQAAGGARGKVGLVAEGEERFHLGWVVRLVPQSLGADALEFRPSGGPQLNQPLLFFPCGDSYRFSVNRCRVFAWLLSSAPHFTISSATSGITLKINTRLL